MPDTLTERLQFALERARDRRKDLERLGGLEGRSKAQRLGLKIMQAEKALREGDDAIKMLEALEGLQNSEGGRLS